MVRHMQYFSYVFLSLFFTTKALAVEPSAPLEVVSHATSSVIEVLADTPVEERTPEMVQGLVKNFILPTIDEQKIAMGALGKHWRRATPEERNEFINIFRDRQIQTYTGAFQSFSNQKIIFSETRFSPDGDKAIVKGEFVRNTGEKVPVDFRLYQNKKSQDWLIYDAVIAGLSMVKTYRSQFSSQLQNKSLSDLINEIKAGSIDTRIEPAN